MRSRPDAGNTALGPPEAASRSAPPGTPANPGPERRSGSSLSEIQLQGPAWDTRTRTLTHAHACDALETQQGRPPPRTASPHLPGWTGSWRPPLGRPRPHGELTLPSRCRAKPSPGRRSLSPAAGTPPSGHPCRLPARPQEGHETHTQRPTRSHTRVCTFQGRSRGPLSFPWQPDSERQRLRAL